MNEELYNELLSVCPTTPTDDPVGRLATELVMDNDPDDEELAHRVVAARKPDFKDEQEYAALCRVARERGCQ